MMEQLGSHHPCSRRWAYPWRHRQLGRFGCMRRPSWFPCSFCRRKRGGLIQLRFGWYRYGHRWRPTMERNGVVGWELQSSRQPCVQVGFPWMISCMFGWSWHQWFRFGRHRLEQHCRSWWSSLVLRRRQGTWRFRGSWSGSFEHRLPWGCIGIQPHRVGIGSSIHRCWLRSLWRYHMGGGWR